MDEKLTWNELHCNIKVALSSLQKLKNILTQSKLDQVYKALFESHPRYSDKLWDNLSRTKLQYLRHLQNTVKTSIQHSRLKDGRGYNWLSISNIIQLDRVVMIYKIWSLCPDSLVGRLVIRSQSSNCSARN